jgi:hypothetical protein
MPKFLTKQEIIEKLQSLPDLPVVVMNDSISGTLNTISFVEVVKATLYEPNRTDAYSIHFDDGSENFTHKVILIY